MQALAINHASRVQPRSLVSGPVWWALRFMSFILAAGLLVGVGMAVVVSPLLGMFGVLWVMLVLVAVAIMVRGLRESWDSTTLEYLEQAVRLNLPLPGMLRAAESGERRFVRWRLARLRVGVENGTGIGDALARALPGLSPRLAGLVVAGERTGRLAPTLRRIVEQDRRQLRRDPIQRIYLRWYPVVLILTLVAVIGAIQVFVMPKMMQIGRDFHIRFPGANAWRALENCIEYAMPLVAICAILFCGQMYIQLFHPRYSGMGPFRRLTDKLLWHLPVARTIVRGRGLGDVCDLLAASMDAGRPLHLALIEAGDIQTNDALQQRLRHWAAGIQSGLSAEDAARAASMPALVSGMAATANAAADLPRAFHFLTRYYDGQFSRAAVLLEGALVPGIAVLLGVPVALVSLSIFVPLTEFLQHVMPKGMGL